MPALKKFSVLELVIVAVTLTIVGVVLAQFSYLDPTEWDTYRYIATANNPYADTSILNRYVHIYIIRAFIMMVGDNTDAAEAFWALQIVLTGFLVYVNSRLLSKGNSVLPGVIGLALFFSQRELFRYAGTPWADLTVMMFIALAVCIYLLLQKSEANRPILLAALGVVFIFAFKSKESAIIIGVLMAAAAIKWSTRLDAKTTLRNAVYEIIGLLLGLSIFAVLNNLMISDILFGLRLQDWRQLVIANQFFGGGYHSPTSYYDLMTNGEMLVILILAYFQVTNNQWKERDLHEKILWVLPLSIIAFLSLALVNSYSPVQVRYVLPVFAVLPVLASQFISFASEPQPSEVRMSMVVLGVVLAVALLTRLFALPYMEGLGGNWKPTLSFDVVIIPLVVTALITLLMFRDMIGKWFNWLTFGLICFLCIQAIWGIPAQLRETKAAYDHGNYPIILFKDEIELAGDERIFVWGQFYSEKRMMCPNDSACAWMFSTMFDKSISGGQIIYSNRLTDILSESATYAFIPISAWDPHFEDDVVEAGYVQKIAGEPGIVFLHKANE